MKRIRFNHHLYIVLFAGLLIILFTSRPLLKQYWAILFWFCLFVAPTIAFLYSMSLVNESEMKQWRKEAAEIDPMRINLDAAEGQRQWLILLYVRGDFHEAAEYAASLSDEVLRFTPCEKLADIVKRSNPEAATRLYHATIERYKWDGTNATGSGEGLVAMDKIRRVENKLKKIRKESSSPCKS
jgi:hypothetical protein